MTFFYQKTKHQWNRLSLVEQMANIGAEVGRTIRWRAKNRPNIWQNAFYRALDLIDFTVADPKNKNRLKEVLRIRELLVDYFQGENIYNSTDEFWEKYFQPFNFAFSRLPVRPADPILNTKFLTP
jgi:hypothetical protein